MSAFNTTKSKMMRNVGHLCSPLSIKGINAMAKGANETMSSLKWCLQSQRPSFPTSETDEHYVSEDGDAEAQRQDFRHQNPHASLSAVTSSTSQARH